jgi:hypothetical protein
MITMTTSSSIRVNPFFDIMSILQMHQLGWRN